jgi:hypothetical protein
MKWFRLYDTIIDDPKILRLSTELRWFYVAIMSVSSRQVERGTLPDLVDIAIHLRLSEDKTSKVIDSLIAAGLIDEDKKTQALRIHGWENRQRSSDDVAERVRNHRKNKDVTLHDRNGNVSVSPQIKTQRQITETETEKDNTPLPPRRGNVVELSSSEDEPPEFPDAFTTIVTIQSGEHSFSEHEARKIWGHLWRTWKDVRLCYGFYEKQRWCSVKGWLYSVEIATKQGQRPGSIKYLQKIGMNFDINGPKVEKPLTKGDIGPVPYKPTYAAGDNPEVKLYPIIREGT